MIHLKRIYDPPSAEDGLRILVDRLWPRGISKEQAHLDEWLRDIAPSDELRRTFNHDPEKWESFIADYFAELRDKPQTIARLRQLVAEAETVTFLYATKEERYNNARALKLFLEGEV